MGAAIKLLHAHCQMPRWGGTHYYAEDQGAKVISNNKTEEEAIELSIEPWFLPPIHTQTSDPQPKQHFMHPLSYL